MILEPARPIDLTEFAASSPLPSLARKSPEPQLPSQVCTRFRHWHAGTPMANGGQVEIRVLAIFSLNGRQPHLLIDSQIDLGAQRPNWWVQLWIAPLTWPLRWLPWPEPPSQWERHGR